MPSRRRRAGQLGDESGRGRVLADDLRGDLADDEEEVVDEAAFPSSTETPFSRIGDARSPAEEPEDRHVASMAADIRRGARRWPPADANLTTAGRLARASNRRDRDRRRSPASIVLENPRLRRRRNVIDVDETDKTKRKPSPITDEPSAIVEIASQTAISRSGDAIGEILRGCDVDSIIGERVDSLTNTSVNVRKDDASRARLRHRGDEDFVPGDGGPRRRQIRNSRTDNSWRTKKNRFFIAVGLLVWCMMIPEIAGRQSHHRTCPGCPHQHVHTINRKAGTDGGTEAAAPSENAPSPDDLRLEAIKHQILTKLGLRTRPDVNRTMASVPRHLALETLYRAEAQPAGHQADRDGHREGRRKDHHRHLDNEDIASAGSASSSYGQFYYAGEEYSYRNVDPGVIGNGGNLAGRDSESRLDDSTTYEENERHRGHGDFRNEGHGNDAEPNSQVEMDDFYARTSEIITFAEPGELLVFEYLFTIRSCVTHIFLCSLYVYVYFLWMMSRSLFHIISFVPIKLTRVDR